MGHILFIYIVEDLGGDNMKKEPLFPCSSQNGGEDSQSTDTNSCF